MTSDSICGVNAECVCGGEYNVTCYATPPAPGVLEAQVTGLAHGLAMGRVTMIAGDGMGHQVGDTLEFFTAYSAPVAVGDKILAPLGNVYSPFGICPVGADGGADPLGAVVLSSDGTYQCSANATPRPPALTESQFIQAVRSSNCSATLEALSPQWSVSDCAPGAVGGATGTMACNMVPGGQRAANGMDRGVGSILGIALALGVVALALVSARRGRGRRARGRAHGRSVP